MTTIKPHPAIIVWAKAPPMSKVIICWQVTPKGPRYIEAGDPLLEHYNLEPGIYVQNEYQFKLVMNAEANAAL